MSRSYRGTLTAAGEVTPRSGSIEVDERRLLVTTDQEDQVVFEAPFSDLTIESGGFEGTFTFCRSKSAGWTVACQDPALVETLREVAGAMLADDFERMANAKRRRSWAGRLSIAAFLLLLGGVIAFLVYVPSLVAQSVYAVPVSVDRQLGDAAFSQMQQPGPVVHDPTIQAFLDEIIDRLAPHASEPGFEFRVTVVESEQVNAFALPGGQMVVLTGLLETADSPHQVAGVMAHEMSHVTLRHGMKNLAHSAGTVLALQLLLGDAEGWLALAGELAVIAKQNDYSREQESAADAEGARMLAAAGLPPEGLVQFFELLEGEAGSELTGALNWLSTHPEHRARIEQIEQLSSTLPAAPPRPLTTDWVAVKDAAARL